MARTSDEIEQSLDTEVANYQQLSELQNNTSLASFWNYIKKVVVFVALQLEILMDKHKDEVNQIIETTETGSVDWYLSICYEYQHGDNLIIENNRPVYSVIDETKQIIKRVALIENNDASLTFKVVKEVAGEFVKLDVVELASFTAYLLRRKIAGTAITVQSIDADLFDLTATIQLDPLIFDSNGKLISDSNIEPVKDAIEKHLREFDFGGTFYLSKLIDQVMNIDGVIDFFITASNLNSNSFTQKVVSPAGYLKLDSNATVLNYVFS